MGEPRTPADQDELLRHYADGTMRAYHRLLGGYLRAKERYEATVSTLVCQCIAVTYFMVPMLIMALHPYAPWQEYNVTTAAVLEERAWRAVCVMQLALAFLHCCFLFNTINLTNFWRHFDDALLREFCLIEQLVVLHYFAWFFVCVDFGAYAGLNRLGWLLFALIHARFLDLVCHWCGYRILVPLVVEYPYLIRRFCARHQTDTR
jgi:hypothetical protein